MKKTLLLFLLILAPTLWAQAQFTRFGAKVGGNFTRMQGDDGSSDYSNNLAGLHGGFIVSYEFVSRLALQAELLYEQKGFVYDDYTLSTTELLRGDHRLHYATLPIMLKIQKGGLFAEGGPYVGYLIAENVDVDRVESSTASSPEPAVLGSYAIGIDDFNRWDYGYTIGVGLQLDNGFFMSLHNTGGLTSFSKELDQKNFGFKLSIGYLLRPRTTDEMMFR
ncbi:porin family protein [Pontibacter rugosus]|uniref:Porin family protein n=1 Tax=Pontibacter rugosus TaxID=1745966 RepID=A0ABW3SNW1_9BACT